jgi:hypothetical protein
MRIIYTCIILALFTFLSCEKDKNAFKNHFNITHVKLKISYFDSIFNLKEFEVVGQVGKMGNSLSNETIQFTSGTYYVMDIAFFNLDDPTNESEISLTGYRNNHMLCFTPIGSMPIPSIWDLDGNSKPVGLHTEFDVIDIGSGSLKIQLLHNPDKDAATPCATGDIDFEVSFPVSVE